MTIDWGRTPQACIADALNARLQHLGLTWGLDDYDDSAYATGTYVLLRKSNRSNILYPANPQQDALPFSDQPTLTAFFHASKIQNPYTSGAYSNLPILLLGASLSVTYCGSTHPAI